MTTTEMTQTERDRLYDELTAAYQDALACGDRARADRALTQIIEQFDPMLTRIVREQAPTTDAELLHDCRLAGIEVVIDCARRYKPTPEGPSFSKWLLAVNSPLRNTIRKAHDDTRSTSFSKAERQVLRVAHGVREEYIKTNSTAPEFSVLARLVALRSLEWARAGALRTRPELAGAELDAATRGRLTKGGHAAALSNLRELLDADAAREVHPDASEFGWDLIDDDTRTHVDAPQSRDGVRDVIGESGASPLLAMLTAALTAAEMGVILDRMGEPDGKVSDLARRHRVTVPAVRSMLDRSASVVAAPHAQFAFLGDVEGQFELPQPALENRAPMASPQVAPALSAPVGGASSGMSAPGIFARESGLGLGARLALAAASVQQ